MTRCRRALIENLLYLGVFLHTVNGKTVVAKLEKLDCIYV